MKNERRKEDYFLKKDNQNVSRMQLFSLTQLTLAVSESRGKKAFDQKYLDHQKKASSSHDSRIGADQLLRAEPNTGTQSVLGIFTAGREIQS